MANENKNIHELASESDEDTSELEILPESLAQTDLDYEFESDAATHSFENLDRQRQDESLASLKLELSERDGEIGRLEYEIEQLRARGTGLETELKAREDATGNLLAELAEARKTLAGARERIERRNEKLARLDMLVREQEQGLAETARALEEARRSAESSQAACADLEQRWQEASSRIASLTAEVDRERAGHARAREEEQVHAQARHELEERHGEARALLETLRQYIEGRKTQWQQQEVLLRTKDALLDEQQRKIRQYASETGEKEARLRREQAANEELRARQAALEEESTRLSGELESLERLLAERAPELDAERRKNETLAARLDEAARSFDGERRAREQAEAALAGREQELAALRRELDDLRPAAAEQDALAARLEDATSKLDSEQAARGELEVRQCALQDELAALDASNEALERSVAEHEEAAAFRLAEIDALATRLAELSHEHEKERSDRQSLEVQCNALEEQMTRLQAEVAEARDAAEQARAAERERERLSGLLIGQRDALRELRQRMEKSEGYADALRRKLGGHAAEAEASTAARLDLQDALEAARAKIDELTHELESGRRREAELAPRVALESELAQANETCRKLRQQIEDYDRKISSKDAAIGVLLSELANKPHAPAVETESEPVIHRLAEHRSPAPEQRPEPPERERLARLLIGTIDGQEVRFPLFKNKLTIGRTSNNDIQLKAQYISRRHAVVVCDNDTTRIVDWGSKNGIYVNGVRVSEKILKNGDNVTVGTAEFRFEERPKR